jgi:glycogen debranching enzyme
LKILSSTDTAEAETHVAKEDFLAGVCSAKRAARLVKTLERWLEQVKYGVPSIDPEDPRFEPLRYWRGPVWIIINWMISNGLRHYG